MENKLYLIREIYDSLSYRLIDKVEQFYSDYNNMLLAPRCFGKTTMAFIDAITECSLNSNLNLIIYVDNFSTKIHYDMFVLFCNELGLEYSSDSFNRTIILQNGSKINFVSAATYRGRRCDYVIADLHNMKEEDYTNILCCNARCCKFIVGACTDFVHDFMNANQESSQTCTFEDLGVI